jgi:hypothetical protein
MTEQPAVSERTTRRIGYTVAIVVNVAVLVVAHNLLDWGWFPWLTAEFDEVLPIITVSIVASIVANAVYLAYDLKWFRSAAEIGLLAVSLAATIRILQVFPFDFSAYEFGWGTLVRSVLGVAIAAIALAMLVQVIRLVRLVARGPWEEDAPGG